MVDSYKRHKNKGYKQYNTSKYSNGLREESTILEFIPELLEVIASIIILIHVL